MFPGTDAGMLHFLDAERHEEVIYSMKYIYASVQYTQIHKHELYVVTHVYTSGVMNLILLTLDGTLNQRGKRFHNNVCIHTFGGVSSVDSIAECG